MLHTQQGIIWTNYILTWLYDVDLRRSVSVNKIYKKEAFDVEYIRRMWRVYLWICYHSTNNFHT